MESPFLEICAKKISVNLSKYKTVFKYFVCDFRVALTTSLIHFENASTLKGKNLHRNDKFFPYRADPFSEGRQNNFTWFPSRAANSFLLE